jgi:hypothetical protein
MRLINIITQGRMALVPLGVLRFNAGPPSD